MINDKLRPVVPKQHLFFSIDSTIQYSALRLEPLPPLSNKSLLESHKLIHSPSSIQAINWDQFIYKIAWNVWGG